MVCCLRSSPNVFLVALVLALLAATAEGVGDCFRPRTPAELAAAIEPLGTRNSSLRVCLDDADNRCANYCSACTTVLRDALKHSLFCVCIF